MLPSGNQFFVRTHHPTCEQPSWKKWSAVVPWKHALRLATNTEEGTEASPIQKARGARDQRKHKLST